MKEHCCTINRNKVEVFKENRSKLIIKNKDRVEATRIKVDGCEITNGVRCDFLYLIKELEIYIELKGQNIEHALRQIETTINKLSENPKFQKKKSFIICTRSPLNSASIQNIRFRFKKNFNSDLIIKSSPHTHSV